MENERYEKVEEMGGVFAFAVLAVEEADLAGNAG